MLEANRQIFTEKNVLKFLKLPDKLYQITDDIHRHGGEAVLVGGAVRDFFLGEFFPKDLDIEIFHLDLGTLSKILKSMER